MRFKALKGILKAPSTGAAVSLLLAAGMISVQTDAALAATGTATGSVRRDFNQNGIAEGSEPAVKDLWVKVFGSSAGVVTAYGPAKTSAAGTYSIPYTTDTTARVEFYGFDANGDGVMQTSESTLPAWLKPAPIGADNGTSVQFITPANSSANYMVANPADYCQSDPLLILSCSRNGTDTTPADFSLYTTPYASSAASVPATGFTPNSNTGNTYGLAFNRGTKQILASAYFKRHTALGPLGLGGLYAFTNSGAPAWSVDLATLGVTVGTIGSNAARGLSTRTMPTVDATAFPAVGRVGIGDIEMSEDGSTAWFTSLADNKLYSLAIPSDGTAPTAQAVGHTVGGSCDKPFAVTPHDGKIYVGVVCTGSLTAEVVAFDPITSTSSVVLTVPLGYTKGDVFSPENVPSQSDWHPWTDTWSDGAMYSVNFVAFYPQAMLSDIVFDADGSMVLGFRDRFGDQTGHRNYEPDGDFPGSMGVTGVSGGDILRVCNTATGLVLEGTLGCASNVTNNEGPGGGEFYGEDVLTTSLHKETSSGGLAHVRGSGQVAFSAMDPASIDSGGIKRVNSLTGGSLATTEVYREGGGGSPTGIPSTFGKANGVGDLEALCDQAPIEIGNRVWLDSNSNGQQDPNEAPIPGVTVELKNASGVTIATAVTNATGNYWFSSRAGTSTAEGIYGIAGLTPNAAFTVVIPSGQSALATYLPTTANTAAVADDTTSTDSDSNIATVATGTAGSNDHTIDFGFATPTYSIGNRVWIDADNDSVFDGSEAGVAGVTVQLLDNAGAVIASTTTDADGRYIFTGLSAGSYQVRVTGPTGYLSSTTDETADAGVDTSTAAPSDNGIGNANVATSAVIVLGPTEPTGETDLSTAGNGGPDSRGDMTVDFGFYLPAVPTTTSTTTTTLPASTTTTTLPASTTTTTLPASTTTTTLPASTTTVVQPTVKVPETLGPIATTPIVTTVTTPIVTTTLAPKTTPPTTVAETKVLGAVVAPVLEPETAVPGEGTLPVTGTNTLQMVLVAFAMMILGFAAMRRSQQTVSDQR